MKKDASSQHGEQNRMNDVTSGKTSKSEHGTDWDKLRGMSDDDIQASIQKDPDIRPTDENFWKDAKVVLPVRVRVMH
jgi:hypothetical protein